jgi:CRISPR-associated helicase Cas3
MEINVRGFSVPEIDSPFKELPFPKIRSFQKEFVENIDNFDILFLSAPTGSGKTLCFEYLCKKRPPVLLIYPTTALMADQERQLSERGLGLFRLDSNTLGDERSYARSRKLLALFQRHDIIITNPDIISAILHDIYVNPEQDLIRIFNYFQFIIYDEFHVYNELELSDILLQLLLFLETSKSKIILSSATPSAEIINILNTVKVESKIGVVEERGSKNGSLVRHNTKISLTAERFKDKVEGLVESYIAEKLKTLVICNSNKFARELYNSLVSKDYEKYVTKDTGDETAGEVKADLTKLIIISTSKSEVGINYPLDAVIIDVAPDIQSFIQRFGRVSRRKDGRAVIFAKTLFELDTNMEYNDFVELMRNYFFERKLSEKNLRSLLEFRAYLVIKKYTHHFKQLNEIFSNIHWRKYYIFFKDIEDAESKLELYGIKNMKDLFDLKKFLEDYKVGLSLLRGQSATAKIKYQRGEDWVLTSYDLLHSLNHYEVNIQDGYIELLEPSENSKIHSIMYNGQEYDFYKFNEQLKNDVLKKWKRLEEQFRLVKSGNRYLLLEILRIDLRRVIIPEEVILRDGRIIEVWKYVNHRLLLKDLDVTPSTII